MGTLAEPGSSSFLGKAVLLCVLPVEYQAVLAHLTGVQQRDHPAGTGFDVGKLEHSDWQVALALTEPGNVGAAVLAERAVSLFRPDVLLCVGVAGALKDYIKLGDIVVGIRIDAYHGGLAAECRRIRLRAAG